jgi:hypothetical protein
MNQLQFSEMSQNELRKSGGERNIKTQNERRATPRVHPKAGSHIVYLEGFGEIRDLSLTGVFVMDSEPLPVGTSIKFSICFGTEDIPVQGMVKRSVHGEGMGIVLIEASQEAKNRLKLQVPDLL